MNNYSKKQIYPQFLYKTDRIRWRKFQRSLKNRQSPKNNNHIFPGNFFTTQNYKKPLGGLDVSTPRGEGFVRTQVSYLYFQSIVVSYDVIMAESTTY